MALVANYGDIKTPEDVWDWHGSYQWTYFDERVKEKISWFLGERLGGHNLEIGGGWYLSYPNSTVLDLSSVCLEKNLAKQKFHFDLEDIAKGKKLPFDDHSFDSATAISVWQYLSNPLEVTNEIRRVLKPGAELYLVHGQGAGLEELKKGECNVESIENFFRSHGYDTLIENIPVRAEQTDHFKSLCVAMPARNLFGEIKSEIDYKKKRMAHNSNVIKDPWIFLSPFYNNEHGERYKRIMEASAFPFTEDAKELMARVQNASDEVLAKTGAMPLVYSDYGIPAGIFSYVSSGKLKPFFYVTILAPEKNKVAQDHAAEILRKSGLNFSNYFNGLVFDTEEEVLQHASMHSERSKWNNDFGMSTISNTVNRYASFLAAVPFNSYASDMQGKIYGRLKQGVPELGDFVNKNVAANYIHLTSPHKQVRRMDGILEHNRMIVETMPDAIVEMRSVDVSKVVALIMDQLVKTSEF